ncbi:DinB family protein, partial [Amycolatopsis sp.]|uniref:DinB family protein n=1 Tax=Amycolatopsis sp. TaxID=37632 RepID=UPI002D80EF69
MAGNVRPVADERDGLLSFLEQQRYVLRLAAHGLTDEQARATSTKSSLSVGGLIKHVAATEDSWLDTILQVPQKPFGEAMAEYQDAHRLRPDETLAGALARYDEVAARTAEVIAGIDDLGQAVPVPKGVPWFPQDVEAWSVRWVLLHLIQETARHAGHADI